MRNKFTAALYFCLPFLFINCESKNQPTNKNTQTQTSSKHLPDPTVKRYIGLFSVGSKGALFRPCASKDSVQWTVIDSTGEMAKMYKNIYAYGYDNQTVMAFINGSLLGKNNEGVTDNTLKISKVEHLEAKDWDGYCLGFEFVIFGSEPFWAVEISPKEKYIDFNDEPNQKFHHFKYVPPVVVNDIRTYETTSFDGSETLKIVIKPEDCSDKANPKPYPFKAEVTLNGKVYNGCAQW
jgi:uncharacterized membrane protein